MEEKSSISKFSTFFVKNYRITFLIFIAILALGYASYTKFLVREGFPTVQFPIVFIQANYFVDDIEKVDEDVTSPIEKSISSIKEIKEIQSTTTNNVALITVEFDQNFSTKEGAKALSDEIDKDANLPKSAEVEILTINAGAIDGKHDLIFTLSASKGVADLQTKADFVASELEKEGVISEANAIKLVTQETNPATGEQFDYQTSFNRIGLKNGEIVDFLPAISIGVVMKGDIGSTKLSEEVHQKVDKIIEEGNLDDYTVTYNGDIASGLNKQISDLENNGTTGLIAVVIILFLIIGWRASIVVAIFIPTVIAATLVGLYLIGYTLNIIVLFGLILVLGLFVDDAIVVVEAIDYQKRKGKKGLKAISAAISDIGVADVAGTLTTILVFLPMAFVSGLLGEFIKLIPITVIVSLILSILIGLTIIPFLSNIFITDKKEVRTKRGLFKIFNFVFDLILHGFGRMINKLGYYSGRFVYHYLKWKLLAFLMAVLSVILMVGGVSFASKLNFSVFPPAKDSDEISMFLTFPEGTAIGQAEEIAKDAEVVILLRAEEYIEEFNYFRSNQNEAYINIVLTPMKEREITSKQIVENINIGFENFGDTRVRVEQTGVGPPIDEFQINLRIFSDDIEILRFATTDIKTFLADKQITETESVTDVLVTNLETVSKVDKKRFASVKVKISDPNNTELILGLQKNIESEYDKETLESLGLAEDALGFDLGQEGENLDSFNSTIVAFALALILMYGLLVFQFNSFLQPLLIFLAIPFSFPLLFPGLYITNNPISFFVMLGIIALSGIVVNNSIFLVDYANRNRKDGKSIETAISKAVEVRFRPIVATSATTIVALLPLTLTDPFWESLGLTIIFGLAASSLMVIFMLPLYYATVEGIRDTKSKFLKKIV